MYLTSPPLSTSTVICNSFVNALTSTPGASYIGNYFPPAKLSQGNFIYVWENSGFNYFGILGIKSIDNSGNMAGAVTGLTVAQAFKIDSKLDDGIPSTGNIITMFPWVANYAYYANASASDAPGTCSHWYVGGIYNPGYSVAVNSGSGLNCVLSFKMQ